MSLQTETMGEALRAGPLVFGWQTAKLQRIADGEFSAQFALWLALKDVRLALEAAGDERLPALAYLATEWQGAVDQGLAGQDLTVITPQARARSGKTSILTPLAAPPSPGPGRTPPPLAGRA